MDCIRTRFLTGITCDNLAEAGIEITEVETHTIIVSAVASKANITFTMVDENGEVILNETATGMLMISQTVELAPGHYTLYFTSDDTILGKSFSYQVIVQ